MDLLQTGFVIQGSSRISYSVWGTGRKLLLCFHGYGESASSFSLLADRLGSEFTILAPDLPFHGGTTWNEGLYFDPSLLPGLIDKMLASFLTDPSPRAALSPQTDRWWVLGYSMGGRVALGLLERSPEKIANLLLLAPDGLKMNPWYFLATQTRTGNRVFRRIMKRPGPILGLLKIAGAAKWINPAVYKFMLRYIEDDRVRDELYKRWTVMRGFKPRLTAIRSIILERHIPVNLVYGSHDRIIRYQRGERFRKGIEPWCQLQILDTGHALLQTKFLDTIVGLLNR